MANTNTLFYEMNAKVQYSHDKLPVESDSLRLLSLQFILIFNREQFCQFSMILTKSFPTEWEKIFYNLFQMKIILSAKVCFMYT